MALAPIDYEPEALDPPEPFASLIAGADRCWDDFRARGLNRRFPRYVASEPARVYAALKHVRDHGLVFGDTFVEWGSGFGVATCLAAQLGFDATGIEIEPSLIGIAERLAEVHAPDACFLENSYVPEGFVDYRTIGGGDIVRDESFARGSDFRPSYPGMDLATDEVDLYFVYPWPGEQEMMLHLFDAVAGPDALLIAYFGDEEIQLYRKLT